MNMTTESMHTWCSHFEPMGYITVDENWKDGDWGCGECQLWNDRRCPYDDQSEAIECFGLTKEESHP